MRLSNFLIWQAAYAEYWSTPLYWPDFGKADLERPCAIWRPRAALRQPHRRCGGKRLSDRCLTSIDDARLRSLPQTADTEDHAVGEPRSPCLGVRCFASAS